MLFSEEEIKKILDNVDLMVVKMVDIQKEKK